jgi:probable rRNA maturation factor
MSISFQFRQVKKPVFFQPALLRKWLKALANSQEADIDELNYLFVGDETLLQVNLEYLQHHTYTDIITFDNSEPDNNIEGDIYISLERVTENAKIYRATAEKELVRVMAHGLLHLLGFNDKTAKEKKAIRLAEEDAIRLYIKLRRQHKKTGS